MHQMRRLREPGKIHQRRRNCSARAVTLLLRLSGEVSQAFIRRVPCPRSRLLFFALPAREFYLPRRFESLRLALAYTLYQKSGLLTEISRRDLSAAGLSGLSLPDARYEHTSIRASATNLTREAEKLKSTCGRHGCRSSQSSRTASFPTNRGDRRESVYSARLRHVR